MNEKIIVPQMPESQEGWRKNKRLQEVKIMIAIYQDVFLKMEKDLETRGGNPSFQKAKELFNQGYWLRGWGERVHETNNEVRLLRGKEDLGYWADGANRHTQEVYEILGLEETDDNNEVLKYLDDLTHEEYLDDLTHEERKEKLVNSNFGHNKNEIERYLGDSLIKEKVDFFYKNI